MFLLHYGATLFMLGLIWFVQVVHYPLFAKVGKTEFEIYEQQHQSRTTWVVAPVMLLELFSGILLFWWDPQLQSNRYFIASLGFLVLIWASTFLIQVPYHRSLSQQFDSHTHQKLVFSNWIRTLAWSLRSLLLSFIL